MASIGRWSMRRPWRAIALWLVFVVLAVGAAVLTGTESLQNGAVGESARGYALMDQHQAWPPTREYGYLHSDRSTVDAQAVGDVARRMRKGLGTKPVVRVSDGGHSALVVGKVENRFPESFSASILAARPAHPGITIEETGDITASDAH